ncbi:MAG TPA: RNA polymerase subunit sigma-70 [Planctomycetaceae bacterium]|nr:RNA polymerase subunit sigma-70 [Planctomycetaceae bacterium]
MANSERPSAEEPSEAAGESETAQHALMRTVYEDLRKLASRHMANQRPGHTLTATALVNEVTLKLLADNEPVAGDQRQFLAYASRAMRNLLVDHARNKGRQKRGGGRRFFSFQEASVAADEQSEELLALHEALEKLSDMLPRKAQVVELRYFGGMQLNEIADALEVSIATVKRDWEVAKAILLQQLRDEGDSPSP